MIIIFRFDGKLSESMVVLLFFLSLLLNVEAGRKRKIEITRTWFLTFSNVDDRGSYLAIASVLILLSFLFWKYISLTTTCRKYTVLIENIVQKNYWRISKIQFSRAAKKPCIYTIESSLSCENDSGSVRKN